ncbi:hypothetical protein PG987_009276 [Apiospora arundinis]
MVLPQVEFPIYDGSGSHDQTDTIILSSSDSEALQKDPQRDEKLELGPASISEAIEVAEGHQAPNIVLPTSIDEMYENLINELESDVNAMVKLSRRLRRLARTSPTTAMPPTTAPETLKSPTPGPLKPKGFRIEKPKQKKKTKGTREERKLQAIQAQAEALLTDPDSDTDETESPTFECRDEWDAVQRAGRLMNPESKQKRPRLVFWTDGSAARVQHTSAVTYKRYLGNHQPWVDSAYGLFGACQARHTELFAVAMALRIACTEAQLYVHVPESDELDACEGEETLPRVFVLTDWAEGLNLIKRNIEGNPSKDKVCEKIIQIIQQALDTLANLGVLVRICWVLGHIGLEGNTRADKLAKAARKYLAATSPTLPREPSRLFEAFLLRPGKLISLGGDPPPDGLYDSGEWANLPKAADTPNHRNPDIDGREGAEKILEEMPLPQASPESDTTMEEARDEIYG